VLRDGAHQTCHAHDKKRIGRCLHRINVKQVNQNGYRQDGASSTQQAKDHADKNGSQVSYNLHDLRFTESYHRYRWIGSDIEIKSKSMEEVEVPPTSARTILFSKTPR
jgi:hypothetical protein